MTWEQDLDNLYEQWVALESSFGDISSGACNAVVIHVTQKGGREIDRSWTHNSLGSRLFTIHLLNSEGLFFMIFKPFQCIVPLKCVENFCLRAQCPFVLPELDFVTSVSSWAARCVWIDHIYLPSVGTVSTALLGVVDCGCTRTYTHTHSIVHFLPEGLHYSSVRSRAGCMLLY